MATRYVDSAATGANDGTTWADAFTTLAEAAAVDTAGDVIYVKSTHSESTAGAVTLDWAGIAASPTRIICVSDSNEPPTTMATGAVVEVTGANNLTVCLAGDFVYFFGIRFKAGDSTNAADISVASGSGNAIFDNCAFELAGNNSGSDFTFSSTATRFISCTFKSVNSGSSISLSAFSLFRQCSIESGGTPGNPFFTSTSISRTLIYGFDFSNLGASSNICTSTQSNMELLVYNSKMPSEWSGSINSATPGPGSLSYLTNSDSTDTNYRLQRKTTLGEVTHETTLVRTGGASNGTTGISWKMVSNADSDWMHQTLETPEIVRWNETTGSSITATVEILHDSATNLTNKELWLEVQYLGTSGFPLSSIVSDAAATYLTAAADQTTSSETWTTTGMSNPNKQKLSVTFTPQEKGYIHAVVKLAKASYTVYVDPMLTVS